MKLKDYLKPEMKVVELSAKSSLLALSDGIGKDPDPADY